MLAKKGHIKINISQKFELHINKKSLPKSYFKNNYLATDT